MAGRPSISTVTQHCRSSTKGSKTKKRYRRYNIQKQKGKELPLFAHVWEYWFTYIVYIHICACIIHSETHSLISPWHCFNEVSLPLHILWKWNPRPSEDYDQCWKKYRCNGMNLEPYLTPLTEINPKWVMYIHLHRHHGHIPTTSIHLMDIRMYIYNG